MYCDHEVFQMFCQYCYRRYEEDTIAQALAKVEEHEQECPKRKVQSLHDS